MELAGHFFRVDIQFFVDVIFFHASILFVIFLCFPLSRANIITTQISVFNFHRKNFHAKKMFDIFLNFTPQTPIFPHKPIAKILTSLEKAKQVHLDTF